MLLLLSPAKSLDMEGERFVGVPSKPVFSQDLMPLIDVMRTKNTQEIMQLMKVSEAIASLNVARYARFSEKYTDDNARQAIFAFTGDVYRALDAASLPDDDILYANDHIRILSGLYGILRPLDFMQPYRLEMGTKLPNPKGENLYDFWQESVTSYLQKEGDGPIVNLASNEYAKAVKFKQLDRPVIQVQFKEKRNDSYKIIGTLAKKARGHYARFVVEHAIESLEGLKAFSDSGYVFNETLSDEGNYIFTNG